MTEMIIALLGLPICLSMFRSPVARSARIGHYLGGRPTRADGARHALLARSLRRALEDGGVTFVKPGRCSRPGRTSCRPCSSTG